MPKLYSYCLRFDDGAAPNPYWGACTLAICKPAIRRTAEVGDWIVGHGSGGEKGSDFSKRVIYAMRVDKKMTMKQYDELCRRERPGKIPDWPSGDFTRRVGDCVYDYSKGNHPRLRPGVHSKLNRERDLGGKNVLWSNHFFYFGDQAEILDDALHPILHPHQGHKVRMNEPYYELFVSWIEGLGHKPGTVLGDPLMKQVIMQNEDACTFCSTEHDRDDDYDDHAVC